MSARTQKGHRLRLLDAYDVPLTMASFFGMGLLPSAFYWQRFVQLSMSLKLRWSIGIVVVDGLFSILLLTVSYHWLSFFMTKREIRLVLHYLLSNHYFESKKRKNGGLDKVVLAPVYLKKLDYATLAVTVEMQGKIMHDLDKFPGDLEKLFFADFKERQDFRSQRLFSKHTYTQFIFSDNKEAQRLSISELKWESQKGIRLMDGEYWDFVHNPHLLIAGGTGGGKTIFLLSLLKVLAGFALLEICDPKKSDLSVLAHFKVFQGHVHSEIDEIMTCLSEAVDFMEQRYREMGLDSEHPEDVKIGNNYQNYGLAPKFVLVDEWTSFYASLDIRKASQVDDWMAQLILKGRQAGVFLIVAMQRPDAEYLSSNLRDNMMARLSLGKLSKTGYRMIFGEDYEDKNYLYLKSKIGRGYAALDGGQPSEFFSPLIPFDQGFSFEALFSKMKPLAQRVDIPEKRESETWTLTQVAQSFELSNTTLTRILRYLEELGLSLGKAGAFDLDDKEKIAQVIQYKQGHLNDNWKAAARAVMEQENE